MIEIATLAIVGYILYQLFIKGAIWPILLFVIGIGGGKILVKQWFPITAKTAIAAMGCNISYAAVICFFIVVLAIGVVSGDYK